MLGITKGYKHSYDDFGVTIKSKDIGNPTKNKIKESLPFMNGSYDFSLIYGQQSYSERELKYVFNVIGTSKESLNFKKIKLQNWLLEGGKQKVYDDTIPGYYFLAECISTDFSESNNIGELTAVFTAYPFKICDNEEGNLYWDKFNFELDILQENKFNVNGTKNIILYNTGSKEAIPTVICSNDMDVIKNETTYKLKSGQSKDYRFTLDIGQNKLTINGTGTIEFKFIKELI